MPIDDLVIDVTPVVIEVAPVVAEEVPVIVELAPVVVDEAPKVIIDSAPLTNSDFVTETVTPNVADIITPAPAEDAPMQIDALVLEAKAVHIEPAE